ncbi:MAG TPA: type II toxin-antitoxin system HicB family antitoxin [Tepidisphaeraceae bacterium]|jgi:predicted RNase H-like HicB family nuclease|nr:type II toxin-antitoxin system HicB family antitoxin [Tepidisphaeraceae bacterium]
MKQYRVLVEQEQDWFIGRVLERGGVTTQGRSLDELVFMLRDAIALMWREKQVHLELLVSGRAITSFERKLKGHSAKRRTPKKSSAAK